MLVLNRAASEQTPCAIFYLILKIAIVQADNTFIQKTVTNTASKPGSPPTAVLYAFKRFKVKIMTFIYKLVICDKTRMIVQLFKERDNFLMHFAVFKYTSMPKLSHCLQNPIDLNACYALQLI